MQGKESQQAPKGCRTPSRVQRARCCLRGFRWLLGEESGGSLALGQSRPSSRTAGPAAGRVGVSHVRVRRSSSKTDRSRQGGWPSQEPRVTLFAVLLPEVWKPSGAGGVNTGQAPSRTAQGPPRSLASVDAMRYGPALLATHLCPSRCTWRAVGCGPAQPSPSGCCFCNLV